MENEDTLLMEREDPAAYMPHRARLRRIRRLRAVAEFLWKSANQDQATLIEKVGLKRYVFGALGNVAHRPVTGCCIVWSNVAGRVQRVDVTLGDYVCEMARKRQDVPRAVVTPDGRRYYL